MLCFTILHQGPDLVTTGWFLQVLSLVTKTQRVDLWYSACVCTKSLQSCLALSDPMDYSLPSTSVLGILPARILEWVAMPSSRGSSRPRDPTHISCIGRWPLVPPGRPSGTVPVSNSRSENCCQSTGWFFYSPWMPWARFGPHYPLCLLPTTSTNTWKEHSSVNTSYLLSSHRMW